MAAQEAPAKAVVASNDTEQAPTSPKKQEAQASVVADTTTHPATLGRIGNDPRDNPGKARQATVLEPGVAKTAAPSPLTTARTVTESHPSRVGRISNDPRAARKSSEADEADQAS